MIEVVLLQDVMATFASNWYRIANTDGVEDIRIGDVFREKGSGEGAEEIRVEAVDISAVAGSSRLLVNRAHNRVAPQSYRMGAVLYQLARSASVEPEGAGPELTTQEQGLSGAAAQTDLQNSVPPESDEHRSGLPPQPVTDLLDEIIPTEPAVALPRPKKGGHKKPPNPRSARARLAAMSGAPEA